MTTSRYYLAPEIYLCVTYGRVVALDLPRDKYLSFDDSTSTLLSPHVARFMARDGVFRSELEPQVAAIMCRLQATGILSTESDVHLYYDSISPKQPEISIGPTPAFRQRIHARDTARYLASVISAKSALRIHRLHDIVLAERRIKQPHTQRSYEVDADRLARLCSVYSRLSVVATSPGRCLFDSLALKRFLAKYRLFPDWIFGVRLEPFAAHCWLQYGDTVLNEALDTVRRFTPIMAA